MRALAVALLVLLAGCATPESRRERAVQLRAEAEVAAKAIEQAAVRCHGLPDPADRESALAEIDEARDALGVARSGASSAAKIGDDGTLDEIEVVIDALRRWAEEFPARR